MIRARIALFLMGRRNRQILDDMTSVVCGTKKNYELKVDGPLIDLLIRRWLHNEDVR
jgi:hypothetical protein